MPFKSLHTSRVPRRSCSVDSRADFEREKEMIEAQIEREAVAECDRRMALIENQKRIKLDNLQAFEHPLVIWLVEQRLRIDRELAKFVQEFSERINKIREILMNFCSELCED